jgi:hypothetical protein
MRRLVLGHKSMGQFELVIGHIKQLVRQLIIEHIKLVIGRLELVIKQLIKRLVVKQLELVVGLIDEQLIFQLDSILLFLNICQLGRILCIFLRILVVHILSSIQLHNNRSPFSLLERIKRLLIPHIL